MRNLTVREAIGIGVGFYTLGSFIAWLIVGEIAGWHKGVVVGATVAVLSVAYLIIISVIAGQKALDLFVATVLFCAVPIGMFVWGNHGHGNSWAWTIGWLFATGIALKVLVAAGRAIDKRWGTT